MVVEKCKSARIANTKQKQLLTNIHLDKKVESGQCVSAWIPLWDNRV